METDELFRKCGFELNEDNKENSIIYIKSVLEEYEFIAIEFDLDHNFILIENDDRYMDMSPDLIKAIVQQCKELGWLE